MGNEFGVKMKQYRKEHYLTQRQMADLIGVSVNHIGPLEQGKTNPRASTVAAFEDAVQKEEAKKTKWRKGDYDEELCYAQIWSGLIQMDKKREKELLGVFWRILDWLEE